MRPVHRCVVDDSVPSFWGSTGMPCGVIVRACAARLRVALEAAGTPIGPHDTLIAATALRHQGTLVTRNAREFARVPGLQWDNWHDD